MSKVSIAENKVQLPLKAIPDHLKTDRLIQVDQFRVVALLADSLFEVGKKLQVVGKLAKTSYWDKSRKKLHIELGDVTFSDGSVLDSKSVVNSISACVKSSERNTTSAFTKIKGYKDFIPGKSKSLRGLKILSEKKLSIEVDSFAPLLKENLSSTACSIVKSIKNNSNDLLNGAIGTGPYTLKERSKGHIHLVHRYGKGPKSVLFLPTDNYGDFQKMKGSFNLILVDSNVGDTPGYNKHKNSRLGNWQFSFNNQSPPFNKLELRKAISLGIDYEILLKTFNWEKERLQKGLFPFGMRGFQKRELEDRNLNESIKIFKTFGYTKKKPLIFTLLLSKRKNIESKIKLLERAFSEMPVKVSVKLVAQRDLIKLRNRGKFDILFHGKASGSHDPHIILSSYMSASRFNTPRVKNLKCDELIKKSLQTYDRPLRWSYYKEAENCLLQTYFIVPLATVNGGYALVKKPWRIARKNQYLLYPYFVNEWVKD